MAQASKKQDLEKELEEKLSGIQIGKLEEDAKAKAQTAGLPYVDLKNFPVDVNAVIVVDEKDAECIVSAVQGAIPVVGVFQNATSEEVKKTIDKFQLDYVQLHGMESPEFCREINVGVIKVFSLSLVQHRYPK